MCSRGLDSSTHLHCSRYSLNNGLFLIVFRVTGRSMTKIKKMTYAQNDDSDQPDLSVSREHVSFCWFVML